MLRMPGQLDNLKSRKRKSNSRKASSTKKKSHRRTSAALDTSCVVRGSSTDRLSSISCECHQSAGRRCSGSPEPENLEGKENERRMGLDLDSCRVYSYKYVTDLMDYEDNSKNLFPDDDSNQILPVEHFFGNLDALQDFPQRSAAASTRVQKGHRRRHYYAPEDSDQDEGEHSSMQQESRGGGPAEEQLHQDCGRILLVHSH
ncbi:UPF0688 protein C1orf174 homolog [Sphaeramia orbicularis]|uniref:UPF0688 protein C1orf174 homolog n=1 Tax=Sphaeramia orbicularis TaxID=375764 RepID=UPI00117FD26D|nr:UPF0688 protein C1orf174 homolog [Sphaeramia orbicularis]